MLLKEIIEEADLYMNNALSFSQKIRFVNQVQRSLYRDYPLYEKSAFFTVVPGESLYELPVDCEPEYIINVYIDEKEYVYKTPLDSNQGRSYMFVDNSLFIQPVPDTALDAYLYYKAKPVDLSLADLESEPPFLKDFHELLVLGCAQKIALVEKDYKGAQELEVRFQNLARAAMLKMKTIKLKRVRVNRRWS